MTGMLYSIFRNIHIPKQNEQIKTIKCGERGVGETVHDWIIWVDINIRGRMIYDKHHDNK